MPSHRADTPPLRRPRTGRSASPAVLRPISVPTQPVTPITPRPEIFVDIPATVFTSRREARQAMQTVPVAPARRRSTGRPARAPHSLSAPQVGIAGVLGIATIAAPISGAMASPAPKAQANVIQAARVTAAPAFPAVPGAGGTVVAFNAIPSTGLPASSTPSLVAAPRTVLVTRASRSGERSVLPGCDGVPAVTNAPNGQLPVDSLCTLWSPKHRLRADAAVALAKLNVAYKQHFGHDICLTDSYRTLSEQYHLKSIKPSLAATPGTSEHGWGLAVDLCDGIEKGPTSSRFQWLRDNAAAYGWGNPDWARVGGSGPYEPWHWEYLDGEHVSKPGQ